MSECFCGTATFSTGRDALEGMLVAGSDEISVVWVVPENRDLWCLADAGGDVAVTSMSCSASDDT